nr:hypothetical protein [Tabrizicola sp.]
KDQAKADGHGQKDEYGKILSEKQIHEGLLMLATCERADSSGPLDLPVRLLWPPDGVNRRRRKNQCLHLQKRRMTDAFFGIICRLWKRTLAR